MRESVGIKQGTGSLFEYPRNTRNPISLVRVHEPRITPQALVCNVCLRALSKNVNLSYDIIIIIILLCIFNVVV